MIVARYTPGSGLGNQMTQYASLYALSRHLDCPLEIPPIDIFPATRPAASKHDTPRRHNPTYRLKARHYIDFASVTPPPGRTIVNHDGSYLENIYNFHHLRDDLLDIFSLKHRPLSEYSFFVRRSSHLKQMRVPNISSHDLVISLRIGDFLNKQGADYRWRKCTYTRFLGFDYFDIILRSLRLGRVFITSDEPFHPLTEAFRSYDPILVRNDSAEQTMAFINRFNRIAMSESTYSWWAAYLSNADEIYFPLSKTGLWGLNSRWDGDTAQWRVSNRINLRDRDLYLRVNDWRYKYVHQESEIIWPYYNAPGRRTKEDFQSGVAHLQSLHGKC